MDYPKNRFSEGFPAHQKQDPKGCALLLYRRTARPESGYPHLHAGYFTEFTDAERDRLKNHWSQVVKAVDYDHGLDFSFGSNYKSGEVSSLRNYLMKYLAKTFIETIPDWAPEELVFQRNCME